MVKKGNFLTLDPGLMSHPPKSNSRQKEGGRGPPPSSKSGYISAEISTYFQSDLSHSRLNRSAGQLGGRTQSSNTLGTSEFRASEARARGFRHFPKSRDTFVCLSTGSGARIVPENCDSNRKHAKLKKNVQSQSSVSRTNAGSATMHNMMQPTEGSANI